MSSMQKNRTKYRAVKVTVDGIRFASKRESERYQQLKRMVATGIITNLRLQPRFQIADSCTIQGRKRPPRYYVADFAYDRDGLPIVEDTKGMQTDVYKLKRHLMKTLYNIDILET